MCFTGKILWVNPVLYQTSLGHVCLAIVTSFCWFGHFNYLQPGRGLISWTLTKNLMFLHLFLSKYLLNLHLKHQQWQRYSISSTQSCVNKLRVYFKLSENHTDILLNWIFLNFVLEYLNVSFWRYFNFPPKYHCVEKTGWCMKCEYKIWSRFHIQHIKIISKTRNNISVPRVSSVKVRMWFLVMRFRMVHYFVNMKILFSVLTTIQDLMTLCVRVETLFNYDHLKCKPNH